MKFKLANLPIAIDFLRRRRDSLLEVSMGKASTRAAAFLYFAFSFCLFMPGLIKGAILLGSTDNYFHMMPNTLFSLDAIKNGSIGLWNPYILGGIDFTASTHNHIWSPLNWPLFLFPKRAFLLLFSYRVLFEFWLVGFFAFLFAREELEDGKWALFAGLLYQLCGFSFFAITTYSNLQLYMLLPLALYVLWTLDRRATWKSLLALSLIMATIMLSANIVYSGTYILLLILASLYRFGFRLVNPFRPGKAQILLLIAGFFAIVLSAVKWLPVSYALLFEGTRITAMNPGLTFQVFHSHFGLTGFIPETYGLMLGHSLPLLRFFYPGDGGHAQFHGMIYWGAVGGGMMLLALFQKSAKRMFWPILFLLASAWFLQMAPFSTIMNVLLAPIVHAIVAKIMIPMAFCFTAAYAAQKLDRDWDSLSLRHVWGLFGVALFVLVSSSLLWAYFRGKDLSFFKGTELGILALILVCGYVAISGRFWWAVSLLILAGIARITRLGITDFDYDMYRSAYVFTVAPVIGALVMHWNFVALKRGAIAANNFKALNISIVVLSVVACFYSTRAMRDMTGDALLLFYMLGAIKYLALTYVLGFFLAQAKKEPTLRPYFFHFVICLMAIELFAFNRNYSRQAMDPLMFLSQLYPDIAPLDPKAAVYEKRDLLNREFHTPMDLDNYRVNRPNIAIGISAEQYEANLNLMYKVPTYGGVNSDVSSGLVSLLRMFNPQTNDQLSGVLPAYKEEKLLDLLGCRYDAIQEKHIVERPTALARLMFFDRFQVHSEAKDIKAALTGADFKALDQVVLESDPGLASVSDSKGAVRLNYASPTVDELEVTVNAEKPGLVYFGDSFNRGWGATVDGAKAEIIRANSNFMAVAVPKGAKVVRFEFRPRNFLLAKKISLISLAFFAAFIALFAYVEGRLKRRGGASTASLSPASVSST